MGLNRSHREYMHEVHQKIYGKSNPWVGKRVKIEGAGILIPKNKAVSKKTENIKPSAVKTTKDMKSSITKKVENLKPPIIKKKENLTVNVKPKELIKIDKKQK